MAQRSMSTLEDAWQSVRHRDEARSRQGDREGRATWDRPAHATLVRMTPSVATSTRARALERVRGIVCDVLEGREARVYLFGSSARGQARRSSDIDVAIDPLRPLPPALLAEL